VRKTVVSATRPARKRPWCASRWATVAAGSFGTSVRDGTYIMLNGARTASERYKRPATLAIVPLGVRLHVSR
jgi:hypothetical protein